MGITNARYTDPDHTRIAAQVDGVEMHVPVVEGNRHYRQIVEGRVKIADYTELQPTKAQLKDHVNEIRARCAYGPLAVSTGHKIDTGPSSRANISGKVLALQAGTASGPVNWRMADNVTYEIAEADFIAIAGEIADWAERLYAFSWNLKALVDAGDITSTDQIDAADWPVS